MTLKLAVVLLAILTAVAPLARGVPDESPATVGKWFDNFANAKPKLTKLHFYFQDVVSGNDPTAVKIAQAHSTHKSPTFFGLVRAFDDPLTEEGDPSSKVIGYGQGLYAATSKEEVSFLFSLTFVFTDGEYNGSTLSLLGRNPLAEQYREMPIVGGTGAFRLARGSVIAITHAANATTQDGIVEFHVAVLHYVEDAESGHDM